MTYYATTRQYRNIVRATVGGHTTRSYTNRMATRSRRSVCFALKAANINEGRAITAAINSALMTAGYFPAAATTQSFTRVIYVRAVCGFDTK